MEHASELLAFLAGVFAAVTFFGIVGVDADPKSKTAFIGYVGFALSMGMLTAWF